MQTEQCLPSVSPVFVQVGSTAWSMTSVCPFAGTSSVLVVLQTVQVKVFTPLSLQVGAVVITPSFQLCPFAGISCCATMTALQTEQCLPSVLPGVVQVGSTAGSMTSVCPFAGISCCATMTSLQTEQCLPSVLPGVVQVAATASSITSVCPLAGISSCATSTSLQTEQCLPSVLPGVVQVASTASSITSV